MHEKITILLVLCFLPFMSGCLDEHLRTPDTIDSLLSTVDSLVLANTVSAPVNPYATPIHIALVGLSAILEALRRKEKSGRKHAEQVLNGNNSSS